LRASKSRAANRTDKTKRALAVLSPVVTSGAAGKIVNPFWHHHFIDMAITECADPAPDVSKPRRCLKCQNEFLSTWPGHRVCDRCKHTSAWREGIPAGTHTSNGR
jgi:hypothetical protein